MRAIVDALDLSELISDCAELPDALLLPEAALLPVLTARPAPQEPGHWHISDECLARVAGMADYGS